MALPNTLRYISVPGHRRIILSGSTISESANITYFERDDRVPSPPSVREVSGWRDPKPYERAVGQGTWGAAVDITVNTTWLGSYPGPQTLELKGTVSAGEILGDLTQLTTGTASNALQARAVNTALAGLKQSNVNLAVAFGERKETARFVGDSLQVIAEVFKAVRKKDVKKLKRVLLNRDGSGKSYRSLVHEVLDKPSSLILQNAYAVTPLVNDIYGVVDELNAKDLKDPKRYALTSHGDAKVMKLHSNTGVATPLSGITIDLAERTEVHEGYRCRLDAYIESDLLVSLASLGVTNPALLAWELLPFSFVVDWALPIGSYLDAFDSPVGLKFRGGSLTRRLQWKRKISIASVRSSSPYRVIRGYTNHGLPNKASFTYVKRSVYTGFPGPMMVSFKNPISSSHVRNALALLVQLTKKR